MSKLLCFLAGILLVFIVGSTNVGVLSVEKIRVNEKNKIPSWSDGYLVIPQKFSKRVKELVGIQTSLYDFCAQNKKGEWDYINCDNDGNVMIERDVIERLERIEKKLDELKEDSVPN